MNKENEELEVKDKIQALEDIIDDLRGELIQLSCEEIERMYYDRFEEQIKVVDD